MVSMNDHLHFGMFRICISLIVINGDDLSWATSTEDDLGNSLDDLLEPFTYSLPHLLLDNTCMNKWNSLHARSNCCYRRPHRQTHARWIQVARDEYRNSKRSIKQLHLVIDWRVIMRNAKRSTVQRIPWKTVWTLGTRMKKSKTECNSTLKMMHAVV